MVFARPLSPSERRTALRRLALYNFTNGLSFAGVAGLGLTAMLMGRAAEGGATAAPGPEALAAYRGYFRAVLLLLLPLLAAVWRIPPLRADAPGRQCFRRAETPGIPTKCRRSGILLPRGRDSPAMP